MPFKSSLKLSRYKSQNKIILSEYQGKVYPVLKCDRPCKHMELAYKTQQYLDLDTRCTGGVSLTL
jgi:hypothetical protein